MYALRIDEEFVTDGDHCLSSPNHGDAADVNGNNEGNFSLVMAITEKQENPHG